MIIKSIDTILKNSFLFFCFLASVIVSNSGCKTLKTSSSKQSLFDSTIVFEPKEGTYASIRIPALVSTLKGTLLAFAEGRVGSASDWAEMDLLMRRSTDGGKT